MDTQLDELAIKYVLIPLKFEGLRLLKARVLAKKEHWYKIYLACFIILHNSKRVNEHILDFSRRFGVEPKPKSNDETSLSNAYYHGCTTVLAYFHFASGGAAPLSLNWDVAGQDTSVSQRRRTVKAGLNAVSATEFDNKYVSLTFSVYQRKQGNKP
ncbi:hypothetical protein OCU04_009765 [Sclerotinia nivalis]|uniref:Uncharacterized protein n=1 Tax=Sclerotinia nivalis TaxID=352851 RepID=A0A9X0DHM9_9HELO|nr:hypothetical protein OCU04_009765 [Sclerotinia nivalis]